MYKVQEGNFSLLQKATSCLTEVHVSLVCICAKMQKTFEAFEAPPADGVLFRVLILPDCLHPSKICCTFTAGIQR